MPMQMPSSGTPAAIRSSSSRSKPAARIPATARGNAPSPGSTSPSARVAAAGSLVISARAPTWRSAFSAERMLPMP